MATQMYHAYSLDKLKLAEAIVEMGGNSVLVEKGKKKIAGWDVFDVDGVGILYGDGVIAVMGEKKDVKTTISDLEKKLGVKLVEKV